MALKVMRPDSAVSSTQNISQAKLNAQFLEQELEWFYRVLQVRFQLYFEQPCDYTDIEQVEAPVIDSHPADYAGLVRRLELSFAERLVLILALIPHLRPQLLDDFFIHNKNFDRGFTEFGGWQGKAHGGFLPTCETAAFIIAGTDLSERFQLVDLFTDAHVFTQQGIIKLQHKEGGEPLFSGALQISTEYLQRLTTGHYNKPDFSIDFPAKLITTALDWNDLVVAPEVLDEIETIKAWFVHGPTIMQHWALGRSLKPGYRCLFHGPPGTGKTLTATLLGQSVGVDVYRIDLSMVVSKYVGETEKNLANVFDQARNKNWVLFFDEADALFGKRNSQASNANDRYANQEISYLLQRIEDFPGVVILATNLKASIDDAFARRFQTLVYFPMPDAEQRLRLWRGIFQDQALDESVMLPLLAEEYALSGGAITNVARYAAIKALQQNRQTIVHDDLIDGITKELRKEGKTI